MTPERKAALLDLLARVEKAEGPDREIDGLIAQAMGEMSYTARWATRDTYGPAEPWWVSGGYGEYVFHDPAFYTASLNDALALVERVLKEPHITLSGPAKFLNIPSAIPNHWWAQIVHDFPGQIAPRGWGATAPLALLAALLKGQAHD